MAIEALLELLAADIEELEYGPYIVLHRELPEYRGLLGQITYAEPRPLVHGEPRYVAVPEANRSLVRPDEANHHVERGGLPGPVGPEEPDDCPRLHAQVHAVDHPPLP